MSGSDEGFKSQPARVSEDRSRRGITLTLPSSPHPPEATRTVEQRITHELRRLIASGELEPGARLPLRQLADYFGVSTTPVRTALIELAAEGLVVSRSHSGVRVAQMSLEEFEEVWTARVGLEWWLARRAVEHVDDSDVEHLGTLLAELTTAARTRNHWPEYVQRSWNYRRYLYARADRPRMLANLDLVYVRSARYSRIMLADAERIDQAARQMVEVHDAVRRRDAVAAQTLLRQGMEWTMEAALEQFVSELPRSVARP